MKQQENKVNFIPFYSLMKYGIFQTFIENFNREYWVKTTYDYQKNNPESVHISNVGGWQSNNELHLHPSFTPLCKILQDQYYNIYKTTPKSIIDMWVNISKFTNYNAPHNHTNSLPPNVSYSGVLYLNIPKDTNNGKIHFLDPLNSNFSIPISPKNGDLLFFPSSVVHYVEPNLTQEDRISIAFNFNL